jgi:hypothetical protein
MSRKLVQTVSFPYEKGHTYVVPPSMNYDVCEVRREVTVDEDRDLITFCDYLED